MLAENEDNPALPGWVPPWIRALANAGACFTPDELAALRATRDAFFVRELRTWGLYPDVFTVAELRRLYFYRMLAHDPNATRQE